MSDFSSLMLNFERDTSILCINVTTIQDQVYELDEMFTVSLMSMITNGVVLLTSESQITILDEDQGIIIIVSYVATLYLIVTI